MMRPLTKPPCDRGDDTDLVRATQSLTKDKDANKTAECEVSPQTAKPPNQLTKRLPTDEAMRSRMKPPNQRGCQSQGKVTKKQSCQLTDKEAVAKATYDKGAPD